MDDTHDASTPPEAGRTAPGPRKLNPIRAGLGFMVLVMAVFVGNEIFSRSGPEVVWLNDLDEALREAGATGRRVFLVLHAPESEIAARNDRKVFSQRYARIRLARMVCCRIEVGREHPLARRFGMGREPLALVLTAESVELSRIEGTIGRRQFNTYVNPDMER